jgi:gliding motility-associated-like protein
VGNEILYPVHVNPRPIAHRAIQRDACLEDIVDIALNGLSKGITNYVWDFDNGTTHYAAPPGGPFGISWSTPGDKLVSLITYSIGCPSFKTIDTVTVHAGPTAKIVNRMPDNICMGDSILMEALADDTANHFNWTPATYFPNGTGALSWGVIQRVGYVTVHVTDKWGCKSADSILANTRPCCQVSFPNAFTPNGDGHNDRFRVITEGHHEVADFRIVNRWGQTVFESRNETDGWDGTFNGQPQDIGTYYYYLRFRCREEKIRDIEQKGEFILIR